MLMRLFNLKRGLLVVVAVAVAVLLLAGPAAFAQQEFKYAENGTDPVARFAATDQDGDLIEWSLSGADYKLFTIDGGVLAFKKSPNYESPKSAVTGGTLEEKNVYNVTIEATGGTHAVAVTVTNVDEAGSVSLTKPQPQAGRGLEATLNDPDADVTDEVWQWARSEDGETWTDIEGATAQQRNPAVADVGSYVRATVTYTDEFGSGKTASGVTANRVEARTLANSLPSFAGQDDRFDDPDTENTVENPDTQVNRSVDENTPAGVNIGKPVSASDADSDILIYTLGGADAAMFGINSSTGQLKTKTALDSDDDNVDTTDETHSVTVTATDPSGASASQPVTITVNDINEGPAFGMDAPTLLRVVERGTAILIGETGTTAVESVTYNVTDDDETADPANTFTYSVAGADRKLLEFNDQDTLAFVDGHTPNYEKQSSYSITIVANSGADDRRLTSRLDVTINVVDAEDPGTVSLSQREPQIGRTVIATLTDPDGGVTVLEWEWATAAPNEDGDCETVFDSSTLITGASSAAYTAKQDDIGSCLIAQATYTDNIVTDTNDDDVDDEAMAEVSTDAAVQDSDPANTAPLFPDQDPNTEGDQSDETSRSIVENKAGLSVGAAASAGDDNDDLLIYTLAGADAGSFSIARNTGQLKTKTALDYETKDTYTVVVTATDPSGAADSILVTINVTDEDDPAKIVGASGREYPENGTDPVARFAATDQDGDLIEWSLSGADYKLFTIDGGVLAFKKSPNYESPKSAVTGGTLEEKNVYNVTIEATGGTHAVAVTVTNVDEAGSVSLTKPQPQAGRGLEATLNDPDADVTDEVWQWARSEDGETWTDIEGATAQQRNPAVADVGSYVRATVTYTDEFGSGKTASGVTANRVEARTLANSLPSFAGQDDRFDDPDTENTVENPDTQVNRSVDENTPAGVNIGKPVSASDADSDILIYTLGGADAAMFGINSSTGQLKTKTALDSDDDNVDTTDETHSVTVTATDPSGASASQPVTITVNDINEGPAFGMDAPTLLRVVERGTAILIGETGTTAVESVTYNVTDDDETADPANTFTYSVAGADRKLLEFNDQDTLAFVDGHTPNYEKQSSYSITIVANSGADDRRLTSRLDVTINVVDAEDPGTVSLSQREPQIGRTVIATLTDPDGGVTVLEWEWATAAPNEDGDCETVFDSSTLITGASSAAYTAKQDDIGSCLIAQATYTDNIVTDTNDDDVDDEAMAEVSTDAAVQDSDPANTAPLFPDQDLNTEGDQSDETSRSVAENKAGQSVGAAVSAGDDNDDLLIYTLAGADAGSFSIARNTGQLKTKTALDYETKDTYTVVVTATDPSGAADSILVTINVTDEDDVAEIEVITGPDANPPEFPETEDGMRSVLENSAAGTEVGAPVAATDKDADDTTTYTLGGADANSFEIDSTTGQIAVGAGTTLDAEGEKTEYSVEVTATDQGENAVTITVTITVEDVSLAGADDYDANSDEMIDRSEAITAVMAYFGGELTKGEAVRVIGLYFSSGG